jgi:hypothetical protein
MELEDIREELHTRLLALDLVDDWLFEIHATAGAEPAEGQYLDVARRCDIDLLIVGDRRSQATEDEYEQAYADNPDKVIPIYLGDGSKDVREFRRLIDGRHSREKAADRGELVDTAVAAVERAVLEGRLILRQVREGFAARLDALDRLLDLDPHQSYIPRLAHGTAMVAPEILLGEFPRVALTGIGGAGKTYGALVGLHRLSRIRRHSERADDTMPNSVIPVYLRANAGLHTVAELIGTAFTAARFFPGGKLVAQYARDGRLVLVIDGYDDLDATARNALIRDVETWSDAYPRSRVMFLARTLPDHALSQFERAEPAQLDLAQLAQLFAAHGQLLRGEHDIPPEVTDLIRRPFWAGALARFGLDVRSGLELIGKVIDRRLELASEGEGSEAQRAREALGELARSARPSIGVGIPMGRGRVGRARLQLHPEESRG